MYEPNKPNGTGQKKGMRVPTKIKGTGYKNDEGLFRIHFPQRSQNNDAYEEIEWDNSFEKFEENNLDLIIQDKNDRWWNEHIS